MSEDTNNTVSRTTDNLQLINVLIRLFFFNFEHSSFTAESDGERILKIGHHLPKLQARIKCPVFLVYGHFGSRGMLPKCPDTSAALPMCVTDTSAVSP